MGVLTLGLNHTTAPLDVRGRFAFAPHQLQDPLRALTSRLSRAAPEAALLSTCNRTELYLAADAHEVGALVQPATEWLAAQGGVSASQLGREPRRGAACVPRRRGPGLDGARRAADPRPDEAGGA
jgi:glutamyl-tRNA reductase